MGNHNEDLLASKYIFQGEFGLEKESLRVNPQGFLAETKHPFLEYPNIERDFCENQIELITGVCTSVDEIYEQLLRLHNVVVNELLYLETGKEYLWPFSNPPYLSGEKDISIASFDGKLKGKELYREYLAEKYGKRKMLFSGIHFNFSFPEALLKDGFQHSNKVSYGDYKNQLYLELAKKITKYSWLIVYLTAASPLMDQSFLKEKTSTQILHKYASARCSEIGYWNYFVPVLKYDDLQSYVESIQSYVDSGQLKAPAELYYPVRLKTIGENSLEHLKESGINHIELRMLDLNPLDPAGIKKEDIQFLHYFIIYLLSLEDQFFGISEQTTAIQNEKNAALYNEQEILIKTEWEHEVPVVEAAEKVLMEMESFYQKINCENAILSIHFQMNKVLHPDQRYAVKIKNQYASNYVQCGLNQIKEYAKKVQKEVKGNV